MMPGSWVNVLHRLHSEMQVNGFTSVPLSSMPLLQFECSFGIFKLFNVVN